MNKKSIIKLFWTATLISTLGIVASFAQPSYPIEIKKTFNGNQFYQGPIRLKMKQVVTYLQPYESAYLKIKKARTTKRVAGVVNGTGALFFAAALGQFSTGDNWFVSAGIGLGFTLIAIPIRNKYNKQASDAIQTYNSGLQAVSRSFWECSEVELLFGASTVRVNIKF